MTIFIQMTAEWLKEKQNTTQKCFFNSLKIYNNINKLLEFHCPFGREAWQRWKVKNF